jgi:hypothetical protein
LCYYLQEAGLLQKFYRRFVAHHAGDPGGYRTLQEVLGREDMEAFQKEWEAFVLKLAFPLGPQWRYNARRLILAVATSGGAYDASDCGRFAPGQAA